MAAVPGQYHVTTPIDSRRVGTSADVHAVIDHYMQRDGASLAEVTVVYLPPGIGRADCGQPLSASGFWPESQTTASALRWPATVAQSNGRSSHPPR